METPLIGQISTVGFNFAPRGWATCEGQLMQISQNQALFSLVGTFYGGDGRSTFGLPDLRGRTAVGQGQHPGGSIHWQPGSKYGFEQQTLTVNQMPTHDHTATFMSGGGSGLSVNVNASTDAGETATPADGSYLADVKAGGSGPDQPELIYRGDAGSGTVALGGVELSGSVSGTVQVQPAGGSQPFLVLQPSLGVNYVIATQGTYPSRN